VRTVTSRRLGLAVVLAIAAVVILMSGCTERSPLVPVTYIDPSGASFTPGSQSVGSTAIVLTTPATTVVKNEDTGLFDLSGMVYDSISGKGVPNVSVTASPSFNVKTMTNGRFYLSGISAGLHQISFSAAGYEDFSYAFTLSTSGAIQPLLDVFLAKKTFSLTGRVVSKDVAATPVEGIDVTAEEIGGAKLGTTITTSTGEFFLSRIPAGLYKIGVGAKSDGSYEQWAQVEVFTNGTTQPANISVSVIPRSFSLQGYVKLDTTKEPLGGIRISLSLQDSVLTKQTQTTSEGLFSFIGLPSGLVILSAQGEGFRTATSVVQINEDGSKSPATPTIYLTRVSASTNAVAVRGNIRDAYSAGPLEFVTITLKGYASTITDRYGYFSLGEFNPGQYTLECKKEGFDQLDAIFTINSDGQTTTPSTLNYYMIYTQETGFGSIVGRYVPKSGTEEGLPVAIYSIYDYTPSSGDTEERNWVLNTPKTPIKETRTGTNFPGNGADESGIFKFTHMLPTTENSKYLIVVGEDVDSATATTPIETVKHFMIASDTVDTALVVAPLTADDRKYYFIADVIAGKTSFVTNYEQENF